MSAEKRRRANGVKEQYKWENDGFAYVYGQYLFAAEKRGYFFDLTEKEFGELLLGDCYICGDGPSGERNKRVAPRNGVDRLDNSLGYTADNVASCCAECNKMKSTFSLTDFLEHVAKIAEHTANVY